MPIQQIKQDFRRCALSRAIYRTLVTVFISVILCKSLLDLLCNQSDLTMYSTYREILIAFHGLVALLLIGFTFVAMLKDIWFTCKQWDYFPIRILNRVTLSNGAFQIALDSPIFVTYTTRNQDEIKKLETSEHATVVAYGTRFIALY